VHRPVLRGEGKPGRLGDGEPVEVGAQEHRRAGALGVEDGRDKAAEEANGVLRAWAEELAALGIEVKGPWLVDFDSGGGYYCWKWPEDSLDYFHSYDEGFAGRVRLQ
jgi:hypothetical protein